MRARSVLAFCAFIVSVRSTLRTDRQFWLDLAHNELEEALKVKWNLNPAKNVILFIGDGMGPNTVTAARIYKGGESHRLVFEKFPHMGFLKTYSANKMVPDSACTATAMFSGVKVNQDTVGVDATVQHRDCEASLQTETRLQSLAALALDANKSAGFVTTMRVTHATPSPLYAHSASRSWECEASLPNHSPCKDIARQLVEDWPGRDLQVIMGGGRQQLVSNATGTDEDPISTSPWTCYRQDGRNLIEQYKTDKETRGLKHSVVMNNQELRELNVNETDYLLGIFSNEHLSYEHERNKGPEGMPSLAEMVRAAIKVLQKNENGYFLMVEGGNIDMAHHRGWAKVAVSETLAMEKAVQVAADMTDEEDTLLIVTSDHTHTLNINGYPNRGSSIFGIAQPSSYDGVNYTTLSYATGGPGSFQFYVHKDPTLPTGSMVTRRDPSTEDTEQYNYTQIAGIQLVENYHGGGDVAIYARGPYSHLFHNVHEQHYVFHAISHAAKFGNESRSSAVQVSAFHLAIIAAISFFML
ncbi:alkaline phosphatase isoform X2 [Spodoptera frugiperda]|uniref:Alkaline phosphatase n=1 Tax=Spodoptera frugiperda TaxID=7108 RepID=A0A9R0EJ86_SPOFR|nr:alkaline phosphatase isoform X2 [Spodoptera frugiperda]